MSLKGILDFQRPIKTEGMEFFYPYEGGDTLFLLPDKLTVASDSRGLADFKLELVRGPNPMMPPKPYGVLDYKLKVEYPIEQGLHLLRTIEPLAKLAPAHCISGFLRMRSIGDLEDFPADFRTPLPITWNSLGTTRFISRVSTETVSLLKNGLLDHLLTLEAVVEFEIKGVAPRVPLIVGFNPFELLTSLHNLSDGAGQVSREALVNFFRKPASSLPLTLEGPQEEILPDEFANTLADWVRVRFGSFVPSPENATGSYMELVKPEEAGIGNFQWDLSQAIEIRRVVALHLDPLAAARQLVEQNGLESIFVETIVPSMQTGNISIVVSANLPMVRPNILAIGLTVLVAPRPPFRVQAINQTIELRPQQNYETILLRLSPIEPAAYEFQTFVVIKDANGIQKLEGAITQHTGDKLDLTIDDFPVKFVLLEANTQLLELSTIQIDVYRPVENVKEQFTLHLQQPSIAVALPKHTQEAILEVEALSLDGTKAIKLTPFPATSLMLGLHSFAEYGAHRITIECRFTEEEKLAAIELSPESNDPTFDTISVLHFTPEQPVKEWSYLASSPFKAGYRFRFLGESANNAWSEVQSPFSPLIIDAADIKKQIQKTVLE